MCHVPIVIGLKLPGATRAIEKAHCTVGEVINKYSNYVAGSVTQQYPAPLKTLAPGTTIRLTVSLGPR
jgi:beta-lactam-binding protein with PASTA domain